MQQSVQVERDPEGLQVALRELFEEAFCTEVTEPMLKKADDDTRERMLNDMPQRTLSPGYYSRAEYILELGSSIEAGVGYSSDHLARVDVDGLKALKRAKYDFERDHPACACGTRQHNRFIQECRSCHAKFAKRFD